MKIGILTFHCAYNYGAVLQCYALQQALLSWGCDTNIIDYRPDYLWYGEPHITPRLFVARTPKRLINKLHSFYQYYRKFKGFRNFEQEKYNVVSINEEVHFDVIVLGSDQIWNSIHNGNDVIWYGVFPKNITCDKTVAYAVSAGDVSTANINDDLIRLANSNLSRICVRETCLRDYLLKHLHRFSDVVLDPVLMVDKKCWDKWLDLPAPKKKYVLVYQGREADELLKIAKSIGKELNCDVISADNYANNFKYGIKCHGLSPEEFVSYVKHAECVITSSFHGTVFSIITQTPFYTVLLNDGADERVKNILSQLNLSDRLIDKDATPSFSKIDYGQSVGALEQMRLKSQNLLKESIAIC